MSRSYIHSLVWLALFAAGQTLLAQTTNRPPIALAAVKTWAYQLQDLTTARSVDALAESHYDLLVVEPSRTDWSSPENRRFDTPRMVRRLQVAPTGDGSHRRLVLAYLNVGEAEGWRWYWTWPQGWTKGRPRPPGLPAFIIHPDPDGWSGDFPVAFWDPTWKDILLAGTRTPPAPDRPYRSLMDEVLQSGFDGVYLDWVEAYDDRAIKQAARAAGVNPAREMVRLLGEIRDYGRRRNPNFIVIQQNAADLLDGHPDLLNAVDGIGQEDVWYSGAADSDWNNPKGHDQRTSASDTRDTLEQLHRFRAAGKPVFTVDYTVNDAAATYRRSRAEGFVPYCTRVSLSRLTTTPPPEFGLARSEVNLFCATARLF